MDSPAGQQVNKPRNIQTSQYSPLIPTSRCTSNVYGSACLKYGSGTGSYWSAYCYHDNSYLCVTCTGFSTRNGCSASMVTTQGDMVVLKFLARNGPRGTYSHFCISRALQSFMTTMPKICWSHDCTGMGSPSGLPGPMKNAYSNVIMEHDLSYCYHF